MLIHKALRYRVYPTPAQLERLAQWDNALRFLWNLALEQRLLGLHRTDKRYPTTFDQINELTDLRAELPWLADVPRNVCAQLLVELDKAWKRCFAKLAQRPRWKRRGRDSLNFCEPHPKVWRLDGSTLRFPKVGNLRAVVHRPLEGKPKACAIVRDGDQWFVSITCEVEINPAPRTEPVIALDRGITHLFATSDGELVSNPRCLQRSLKRLAHAQRRVSRRKKGSRNREKAKLRVARLHRTVRRQRDHVLHVESARLAKSHGIVVIEKLNGAGMIRSRLARSIADAAWARLGWMLSYKLAWSGGNLVEVPAAYSSQTCAVCGHVDADSRHGEVFVCTRCGNKDHADVNAGKVLKARANRSCLPVEASGLPSLGSRKLKVKLRVPRRSFLSESRVL